MTARYQFVPWVRSGGATAYTNADTLRAALARPDGRPITTLPVQLAVNAKPLPDVPVRLYGPGDITGIDPRVVIRSEPPPGTADAEPNYLACIEFDTPDFPWMFTPAAAGTQGRLRPWLSLVVLRSGETTSVRFTRDRPLPFLTAPAAELPNLLQSWAWAHAQVVQADAGEPVGTILAAHPERNLSRLICPRRLEPHTAYVACLVPAFDIGRLAGLGLPVADSAENSLAPAWDGTQPLVELPVYHHWSFATGVGGDFESLTDRLEGRSPGPVGRRSLRATGPLFGLGDPGGLEYQGALVGQVPAPPAPGAGFRERLRTLLNLGAKPVVAPPVYGSWQAAQPTVPADAQPPRWLRELNLDPAQRAAAGLGARVVRERQEELVTSAWQQLGDVTVIAALERRLELGAEVLGSVIRRHLEPMPPGRLLQFLGPAQTRMRAASSQTVYASLARQGLASVSSAPLRRTLRPAGTLARRRSPAAPSPQRIAGRLATAVAGIGPPPQAKGLVGVAHLQARIGQTQASFETPAQTRYRTALTQARAYLAGVDPGPPSGPPATFALDGALKSRLLESLSPHVTLSRRLDARVRSDDTAGSAAQGPARARPSFGQPMYESLRDLSPELLLPGAGRIAPDTVTVLKTNPRFIESFMAGLNHELSSELVWREFPGDVRHTYFRSFWDAGASPPQLLPEIASWRPDAPLGGNAGSGEEQLVLLIRGELLRRYPDALIYAVPADDPAALGARELLPSFRGQIGPDITFLGFALTEERARRGRGWFFVIQEQPSAPRFGLDEARSKPLQSWNDLGWNDLRTRPGASLGLGELTVPAAGRPPGPTWGFNGAHMAAILRQRPVRVAFHASRLLPPAP